MNKDLQIAKKTVQTEIQALKKLSSSFNRSSNFSKTVSLLTKMKGKCLVVGVGKSFHVASQMAASLSSVGAPSFALSANDCSHGDLGSITKKDVLIMISNSGESEELKPIASYANRNKITLIGKINEGYKKNSIKLDNKSQNLTNFKGYSHKF